MADGVGRRRVLAGTAGLGLATPLLAACGGDDGGSTASGGGASPSGSGSKDGPSNGSGALTTATDVPVGGGAIFADDEVVVTQPSEGEFKAFSSVCTHQGCPVGKVENGQIVCPCHGSAFSVEDGSVQAGPATAPLEAVEIKVEGDRISLA